jgi:ketosteroid isomerase-like protein
VDYEEKLNLTHESYEAFNRNDLEGLLQLYDADCEWNLSNYAGWPERQVYRGREGLAEFFEAWLDPWEDFSYEVKQVVNLPGSRVLVVGYGRGHGRHSGAEVELGPIGQIIDFRGGKVLRVNTYSDVEEARNAAGLSEQDVHADS